MNTHPQQHDGAIGWNTHHEGVQNQFKQLAHSIYHATMRKPLSRYCWQSRLTLADSGSASKRFVCWPMATPLTQVVVVNPFLRDITLVPCKFSIRNFFLHKTCMTAVTMQGCNAHIVLWNLCEDCRRPGCTNHERCEVHILLCKQGLQALACLRVDNDS